MWQSYLGFDRYRIVSCLLLLLWKSRRLCGFSTEFVLLMCNAWMQGFDD